MREFDAALKAQFGTRLTANTRFEIYHEKSYASGNIQAADFVSHAFYQKHQHGNAKWYDLIARKVAKEANAIDLLGR